MKNIFNILLRAVLAVTLALVGTGLYAQSRVTVKGSVKDAKGEPVIGAVVMLEGSTTNAAVSDASGNYTISFPQSAQKPKLTVSCMSYLTQTVEVAGRSVIDFVLRDDAEQLEEVVVVGYGSMRRSDLTGSVTSVKIDETEAAQSASFDKLLQGRAAGVQVVSNNASPDAGVSIRVRGLASFNGSSEPLYVVDGVIIDTSAGTSLFSQGQDNSGSDEATNGLMGINPQDIANIEILKDASATAIYGSQGANGVVLITTKTANRDRPQITASVGVDVAQRYKKVPVFSFDEYVDYLILKGSTSNLNSIYEDYTTKTGLKVVPMDWQDYVMRTAVSQRYFVSVAGKPRGTSYRFSFSYNNVEGIVRTTGYQNYTIRLNLDKPISKKFTISTRSGVSYLNSNLTQGATTGRLNAATSMMRSMVTSRPYDHIAVVDEDEDPLDLDDGGTTYMSGPKRWISDFVSQREEFRVMPQLKLSYKFTKWLTFSSQFGADYRSTENRKWKSNRINTTTEGTIGAQQHVDRLSYNMDNLLQFNKKFGRHHTLYGTLGMSLSKASSFTQTVEGWNIEQRLAKFDGLNTAPNARFAYGMSENQLLSYYVRGVYNFRDRYSLTATYRFDGSSRFQGANKWSQFPSFAGAWRIHQEPWFHVPVISQLKLRLGWGRVGNQAISNYQTMSNFSNVGYPSHDPANAAKLNVGLYPNNLANPDLKWETSEQLNAGLDLGLWKGRLALSVDAYRKMTYDLLQSKAIAGSTGFSSMWVNMGSISNKGLEFTLDATPIKTRDFEFGLNANISFNRNRVEKIGDDGERADIFLNTKDGAVQRVYFYGSSIGGGTVAKGSLNLFVEGEPIAVFYGFATDGLVQEGETGPAPDGSDPRLPGSVKYVDVNGDGFISESDRVVIGDPNPDFTYGFNMNFNYKRLVLNVGFVGSYGNDIYNVNAMHETNTTSTSQNLYRAVVTEQWTPENPNTWYPAIGRLEGMDLQYFSDRFVEDGSYLRLSNVSLSYQVPVKKGGFLKGMSIGLTASNLYFWTKFSGFDPDVNAYGSVMRMGCEMGSYPGQRAYRCDVKFTF